VGGSFPLRHSAAAVPVGLRGSLSEEDGGQLCAWQRGTRVGGYPSRAAVGPRKIYLIKCSEEGGGRTASRCIRPSVLTCKCSTIPALPVQFPSPPPPRPTSPPSHHLARAPHQASPPLPPMSARRTVATANISFAHTMRGHHRASSNCTPPFSSLLTAPPTLTFSHIAQTPYCLPCAARRLALSPPGAVTLAHNNKWAFKSTASCLLGCGTRIAAAAAATTTTFAFGIPLRDARTTIGAAHTKHKKA
jgi:hypothetical protein